MTRCTRRIRSLCFMRPLILSPPRSCPSRFPHRLLCLPTCPAIYPCFGPPVTPLPPASGPLSRHCHEFLATCHATATSFFTPLSRLPHEFFATYHATPTRFVPHITPLPRVSGQLSRHRLEALDPLHHTPTALLTTEHTQTHVHIRRRSS